MRSFPDRSRFSGASKAYHAPRRSVTPHLVNMEAATLATRQPPRGSPRRVRLGMTEKGDNVAPNRKLVQNLDSDLAATRYLRFARSARCVIINRSRDR